MTVSISIVFVFFFFFFSIVHFGCVLKLFVMPTNAAYPGSMPSFKTASVLHSCFMQSGHILISLTPTAILQTTKDEVTSVWV